MLAIQGLVYRDEVRARWGDGSAPSIELSRGRRQVAGAKKLKMMAPCPRASVVRKLPGWCWEPWGDKTTTTCRGDAIASRRDHYGLNKVNEDPRLPGRSGPGAKVKGPILAWWAALRRQDVASRSIASDRQNFVVFPGRVRAER